MDKQLTNVTLAIDLEKFRYSLIGDGYIKEEVIKMSQEDLISELKWRVDSKIAREYESGRRMGWYD
jgi:hypothetical protein